MKHKSLLLTICLLLLLGISYTEPLSGQGIWDKGWNFRDTDGVSDPCMTGFGPVTDAANTTYFNGVGSPCFGGTSTDLYDITRNSVVFGSLNTSVMGCRDRNDAADARLAGVCFSDNPAILLTMRFDLPGPGTYLLNAGMGDPYGGSGATDRLTVFRDNDTTLKTSSVTCGDNEVIDLLDNCESIANWLSTYGTSTIPVTVDATCPDEGAGSGIYCLYVDVDDGVSNSIFGGITHLFIQQQASVAACVPRMTLLGLGC